MADEQISILITAVDDVSKKLDTIKKNVTSMASESTKQTNSLAQSFDKAQGNLLILGNAAARVDSIFDSYRNMQLRVENATTRVYEAQKNVRDAQYALNKVMSDGTATIQDVAKAKDDLDTATNRLSMSQNNLERTNNEVTGTFIQMGMSVVTLIASLPMMAMAVQGLAASFLGLQLAAGPIMWVLAGIGVAITAVTLLVNKHKKEEEEAAKITNDYEQSLEAVETAHRNLGNEVKKTNDALTRTMEIMGMTAGGRSEEELKNVQKIAMLKEQILINEQGNATGAWGTTTENRGRYTVTKNILVDNTALEEELKKAEELQRVYEAKRETNVATNNLNILNKHKELGDEQSKIQENVNNAYIGGLSERITYLTTTFASTYETEYQKINDELKRIDKELSDDFMMRWGAVYDMKRGAITMNNTSYYMPGIESGTSSFPIGGGTNKNVTITDKTGKVTEYAEGGIFTKPTLGIIGEAGPEAVVPLNQSGGFGKTVNIYITGNNYGVNAEDIASVLNDKLGLMVRTW